MNGASLAEIEDLLSGTMMSVQDTKAMIQTMLSTQTTIAEAQRVMSNATQQLADTFNRMETRQVALEATNLSLYKDKGIAPNIFFLVTGTLCGVIILGAIWLTDTSIKATLTSFEAGKKQIEQSLNEVKNSIEKHGS